ncbi:MAG: ABC transporter ATP-binding protein [Promethearchaeota archaeon]
MTISEERITPTTKTFNGEKRVVLILKNITKKYRKHIAVDNMNIKVREGETIGLVGPNGAGKTTTIKMIAKLLRPTSGKIFIINKKGKLQDLSHNTKNLEKCGFLIDIPSFYVNMTAYQHLRYFALSQKYPKDKINKRIDELLQLFKLYDWKHKKVKIFSKGMKQKLGILQAILVDPQIIILDEPQTGLDPKARVEIRKIIRDLRNMGKTIFVASHMVHEISEVCDKIAFLNHGEIIAFDTMENLEINLKTTVLNCELLEPINPEKVTPLIDKLTKKLEPYLNHRLNPAVSELPIKYISEKKTLIIYSNSLKDSKVEILKILIKDFEADLKIESYSQPKTSQLERIYTEMIIDDEPKIKLKKKEVN